MTRTERIEYTEKMIDAREFFNELTPKKGLEDEFEMISAQIDTFLEILAENEEQDTEALYKNLNNFEDRFERFKKSL